MRNKLLSLMIGLLFGAFLGGLLVMIFAPVTGKDLRQRIRSGVQQARDEAAAAETKRREELEAELARMRGG